MVQPENKVEGKLEKLQESQENDQTNRNVAKAMEVVAKILNKETDDENRRNAD